MAILTNAETDPQVCGLSVYYVADLVRKDPSSRQNLKETKGLSDGQIDYAISYAASHPRKQMLFG